MDKIVIPLYDEVLSSLRSAPSSSDWFPFPSNFFSRPEISLLSVTYQLHAVKLLLLCCRLKSSHLSSNLRYLCNEIGVLPSRFSLSPLLESGFLSLERIEREKDRKNERNGADAKPLTKAELTEIFMEEAKKRKTKTKDGGQDRTPLQAVK